jgi:hypothetical protein
MLTLRVCVTNARSARPNILGRSQTWSRCCIASELRSLSPVPVRIVPFRCTSATVFDTSRVPATRGILNADVNFALAWTSLLPASICSLSIGIRICAARNDPPICTSTRFPLQVAGARSSRCHAAGCLQKKGRKDVPTGGCWYCTQTWFPQANSKRRVTREVGDVKACCSRKAQHAARSHLAEVGRPAFDIHSSTGCATGDGGQRASSVPGQLLRLKTVGQCKACPPLHRNCALGRKNSSSHPNI